MGRQTPPDWRPAARKVPRVTLSAALLVVAALLLVAVPTLGPTPGAVGSTGICVFCGALGGLDFALNLALFVPLGAAIWNATGSWRQAGVAGFLVSMVIEVLQYRLIAGRDAAVGDVLANGLGSLTGAWIMIGLRARTTTPATALRLAAAVGLLTALLVASVAMLLLPRRTRYTQFVHWSPILVNEPAFLGSLESAELNGRPLHRGDTLRPSQSFDSITRSYLVKATVRGPVPVAPRSAVIVRVAHNLEETFQLTQRGDGVAFRAYSGASRFRLRTLQVGLDDALLRAGSDSEGSVTIEAQSTPERIMLSATRRGERITSATLPRTLGLAWAIFLPWNAAIGPDWWLANAAWVAALMFPVSLLTARAQRLARSRPTSLVRWWPIAVVALTLVAMAPLTGLSQLRPFEWLAAVVGTFGGIVFDRFLASRFTAPVSAGDTTS